MVCRVELTENTRINGHDWQVFIHELAGRIMEEQSPARLREVRSKLYELLTHCISPETIIKSLSNEINAFVDDEVKLIVCRYAAEYEHRLQMGNKAIYHLEAFVARLMSEYRKYLDSFDE